MGEICQDQYQVTYDPATATVVCTGSFRLPDQAYVPIAELLNAAAAGGGRVTLDLCAVRFLNSSGINTLAKFVIRMRQQSDNQLVIKGSGQHPWQRKSLKNFARLLPGMQLEWT